MALRLKNPHSVLAALRKRPKDVFSITLPFVKGDVFRAHDAWESVLQVARDQGVAIVHSNSSLRKNQETSEGGRTSVAEASIKELQPVSAEDLFSHAIERAQGRGLWLALDCLQDPHNVGAIFRTAAFFGIEGIILTQERSAPLSATAYDVASGGLEYIPFTLQTNLIRCLELAKKSGIWILGTSEHAHDDLSSISNDRPWLVVLGSEERGMRRLTEEACDVLCKISSSGGVSSLNVSVAVGVFLSKLSKS